MFKTASWRSEKKIKAVFIMQFQATQVPQLKAKKLMISLIPADVGKPTVRLGKAAILEGTCSWESPIYETVKLVRETKTGKIKAKIYHFIVSTGSSKSGYLGEASVDFAYLLEATTPVMLSLPLQASDSGAILHVTIQKLEGSLDQRGFEEEESATSISCDRSLELDLEENKKFERRNTAFIQEEEDDITTPNHPKQIGSHEVPQSMNSTACPDTADATKNMHEKQRLLNQIKMLERQAEVSELELQSLRKQIVKESRKVEEFSRDIVGLKKERDFLKAQCEGQKSSPESIAEPEASNSSNPETAKFSPTSEGIRQELQHEKHLNRKLRFLLQKTEDSNSELILAVRDLKEMLNKKHREISDLSSKIKAKQDDTEVLSEVFKPKMAQNEDIKALEKLVKEDRKEDEVEVLKQMIRNLNNEAELSSKEKEEISKRLQQLSKDYEILEKEKRDMYSDLQKGQTLMKEMKHEYRVSLATVKQLKLQLEQQQEEINQHTLLSSKYLAEINNLETQVQSLEEKLEKQALDFEYDRKALGQAKVEEEQRSRQVEETLAKVNRRNASLVEHLKAEFARTSKEMEVKIDEKEKLAVEAVAEANRLLLQNEHLEKLLQETKDKLVLTKDAYERKLQDLSHKIYPEAQHAEQSTPDINDTNTKFKTMEVQGNYEARTTENQMIKGERRQQIEKRACKEGEKQKGWYDKEQREIPHGELDIHQRWRKEEEELRRQLSSAKKEAKKLFEDNICLRNLIDEKKRMDEILHLDMEKLTVHHHEQRHCSLGLDLENEKQKSQVFKLKQDRLHNNEQESRLVNDAITCNRKLEERRKIGENLCSRKLGNFKGNTAEVGFFNAQTKSNATHAHAGRVAEMDSEEANNCSDLAQLLDEVAMLKEHNKQKEVDLKEMQERYSEISLKFAEVEGERQQLVMALRNLKNGKKT